MNFYPSETVELIILVSTRKRATDEKSSVIGKVSNIRSDFDLRIQNPQPLCCPSMYLQEPTPHKIKKQAILHIPYSAFRNSSNHSTSTRPITKRIALSLPRTNHWTSFFHATYPPVDRRYQIPIIQYPYPSDRTTCNTTCAFTYQGS